MNIKSPNKLLFTLAVILFRFIDIYKQRNIFNIRLSFETQPKIEFLPLTFRGPEMLVQKAVK